ncbi:MAG: type II secretion system protein [Sedimentisphaerales bacterium]|nr:type II secretion system protein [Sedimentisphaerales bacterium]
MKTKKGFSLIEILTVITVIASLLSFLMPVVAKARLQAKILKVNYELGHIALALEAYAMNNDGKYPPTRTDCDEDARIHAYALPKELITGDYLPGGKSTKDDSIIFAMIEDEFNPGCAYKYIAPGVKYDYSGSPMTQCLYVPQNFPYSMEKDALVKYNDSRKTGKSPVRWVLFSMGPNYPLEELQQKDFPIKDGFPVKKDYWYDPDKCKGILTRLKMTDEYQHFGTFQRHYQVSKARIL